MFHPLSSSASTDSPRPYYLSLAKRHYEVLLKGVETIKDYAIFILDTKGHILTWNSGAEAIKGYKSEEIIGQYFSKFYEPQAVEAHYPEYELKTAIEQGRFEDEGWRVRKDGSTFWANVVITAIFDERNEHIGFVKVTRDLTERKQAELAIAESEHHYRTLASIAPVGVFHCTPQGHLTYANEQTCQIMGLSLAEILGEGWINAIHPEDRQTVISSWRQALKTGIAFSLEYRFYHPQSDTTIWVINQAQAERDEKNQIKSYVQTLTNINERKKLEESESTQKRLKEFVDTICHEIRNPLNGMMGSTEMLKDTTLQLKTLLEKHTKILNFEVGNDIKTVLESLMDIYSGLDQSVRQQKLIVDDVLDYSKLAHSKLELKIAPFSPKNVILTSVQIFMAQFKQKNIQLKLISPEKETIVEGDEGRLKQVLINLLSNALKFTEKGSIQITLAEQWVNENTIELTIQVADTGMGMNKEEVTQLFKRFMQFGASSPRTSYEAELGLHGTGLGLNISKKLIEKMGGCIEVNSEKDKGTEISIIVPLAISPTQTLPPSFSPKQTSPFSPAVEGSARKALIVEDNLLNQKILANYIKALGWDYQVAENGLEALSASEETAFDVIFMDIEMPVMNGLEATKQIRQREQRLNQAPVLIIGLSGNAQKEQIKTARDAGMDDYITKPFHRVVITNLLHKLSPVVNVAEKRPLPALALPSSENQQAVMPFFQPSALLQSPVKKLTLEFKAAAKELVDQQFTFRASCENATITMELGGLTPYLCQCVLTQLKQLSEQVLQPLLARATITDNRLQLVAPTAMEALKLKAILSKAGFAQAFNQACAPQTARLSQEAAAYSGPS
jgi:PAS domain S-box-containing protein